jgi:hypothetical protein
VKARKAQAPLPPCPNPNPLDPPGGAGRQK